VEFIIIGTYLSGLSMKRSNSEEHTKATTS